MNNTDYILCLPIEITRREMLSKLYLALKIYNKGLPSIIASYDNPVFDNVVSGFYLHKDHAEWSEKIFLKKKKQGLEFGCLDEEGLIYDEEKYKEVRCSNLILKKSDVIFAWGKDQAGLLKGMSHKLIEVGNPRFDILNLSKSSLTNKNDKALKKVLINTRFAACNPFSGPSAIEDLKALKIINNAQELLAFEERIRSERVIFDHFISFIKTLSENKNLIITVRPHPAESLTPYLKLVKYNNRIKVDNSTELVSQILENDIIVHEGCTTAIEALAAGKIVLGLCPKNLNSTYSDFANKFSLNFTDLESIVEYISDLNLHNNYKQVCDIDAENYIANWGGNCSSTELIIKEILGILESKKLSSKNNIKVILNSRLDYKFKIKNIYRSRFFAFCISKLFGEKGDKSIISYRVDEHKFPSLKRENIERDIRFLKSIDPSLSIPKIKIINEKAFMLYN